MNPPSFLSRLSAFAAVTITLAATVVHAGLKKKLFNVGATVKRTDKLDAPHFIDGTKKAMVGIGAVLTSIGRDLHVTLFGGLPSLAGASGMSAFTMKSAGNDVDSTQARVTGSIGFTGGVLNIGAASANGHYTAAGVPAITS